MFEDLDVAGCGSTGATMDTSRLGRVCLAAGLLAASAIFAFLAWRHWAEVAPFGGAICGAPRLAHCGWCYASIVAGLAGVTLLSFPLRAPRSVAALLRRRSFGP